MFAVCLLVLLSSALVSHAAPAACEDLLRPLDQLHRRRFEGKWALVAGSLDHESMESLRLRDSVTMYFSNSSETSTVSYVQVNRFGERCQHLRYNVSVPGSTFHFDVGNRFELSGSFLRTSCPDCLVMLWDVKSKRRTSTDMYLLSRRREVEAETMQEFRAQLSCSRLPTPVVMDPSKELCPEDSERERRAPTVHIQETTVNQSDP